MTAAQGPSDSWIPGYRFVDGKLLVFERDRITLVKAWPDPDAVQKIGGDAWQAIFPEFRLVRPYRRRKSAPKAAPAARQQLLPMELPRAAPSRSELAAQKKRAFDSLRFSLPRELARAIERFQCGQFALIRTFRAAANFLDLLISNPPLAFFLADRLGRREFHNDAERLAGARQADVAGRLGFPATPATARTLRKVVPESVTPESAQQLREALCDDDARAKLAHLQKINAGVIGILGETRLRAAATPSLLEEVAAEKREKYRAETASLLLDVLELETDLRGAARLPPFKSLARLRATHHALSEEYVATKENGILDCTFPRPPIRGTPTIVALTQPRDVIAEGRRQNNCVASYAHRVARGETYIYRVLQPQRATLAIRRTHGGSTGSWYVSELLASCNQPVSPTTERTVQRWLDERTVSA